jgi:manganese/zinc/iron transport system substrate-binding protein
MKHLKHLILLVFLPFCFIGCSSSKKPVSSWRESNGKIKVLSTTAMINDLVQQVGKERVDAIPLISGELDPHSYELVKGDDEKLSSAQVVFSNGLGLEHGASLRYWIEKHPSQVALGDEIRKNYPERIIREDKVVDPHIWMDISLWALAIDPIVKTLSEIDPEGAAFFAENGEKLHAEMMKEHEKVREQLRNIPQERRFLVTSHDAFNYFTRVYLSEPGEEEWEQRFEAPEGLSPDGQLSAKDIQRIIDHLCLYKIEVVFPESNVSRDSLRKIVAACREKGLRVKISEQVLYGDAMGGEGSNADTYLKMMQHNSNVLFRDWSCNE